MFVLHTKMVQFSWEVAEELAFLEDPRQIEVLEARSCSLVPLLACLVCPLSLLVLSTKSQPHTDLVVPSHRA